MKAHKSKPKFGASATRTVGYFLVVTTALLIFIVTQELVCGTTIAIDKWGPRTVYSLAGAPFKYWASVVLHCTTALVLGALAAGAFWLARLESNLTSPTLKPHRK